MCFSQCPPGLLMLLYGRWDSGKCGQRPGQQDEEGQESLGGRTSGWHWLHWLNQDQRKGETGRLSKCSANTARGMQSNDISTCVFLSFSSWGCAATRTRCWSTRCWQRSGALLLRTWWWRWWEEMSWLRWSHGSGTRWGKDWWRLHKAQVGIQTGLLNRGDRVDVVL